MVGTIGFSVLELVKIKSNTFVSTGLSASVSLYLEDHCQGKRITVPIISLGFESIPRTIVIIICFSKWVLSATGTKLLAFCCSEKSSDNRSTKIFVYLEIFFKNPSLPLNLQGPKCSHTLFILFTFNYLFTQVCYFLRPPHLAPALLFPCCTLF